MCTELQEDHTTVQNLTEQVLMVQIAPIKKQKEHHFIREGQKVILGNPFHHLKKVGVRHVIKTHLAHVQDLVEQENNCI